MEKITSVSNNLVKETAKLKQKKYRDESGKFLLEGFKSIHEAFLYGVEIDYVFVNEYKLEEYNFLKEKLISVNDAVLKKISTTETPPDAVGVGVQKLCKIPDVKNRQKVLLLENIKDAGNLGTILRTSAALGVELVVLFGDCVDLYNPKVVRSAAGCLWKLPVVNLKKTDELTKYFDNYTKIATLPRTDNLLKTFETKVPFLVMFGSEANGLSDELIKFSNKSVKIEMKDNVESLNLSVSCAIVLYKLLI